jgi:serine/threonine protein kinase/WD40 repeat protein
MRMHQPIKWQERILLKRYRLLQKLGHGSTGEVWLAEDRQLQRQVAIKLLPTVLAADKPYLRAFAQEARLAAELDHPHILPIHSFGTETLEEDQIVPFLVTPYMSGGSLREHLQDAQGLLPIKESLHYLKQGAQALDYAHSKSILHRDIKPSNMLLHQQSLYLTDFGIAKILTGTLIGTAEYTAPEQARGRSEAASDLYSLAMTAYQLFTGVLPFKGETPYAILTQQLSRDLPSPRDINPAIPPPVAETLTRALAKQPADRFPSCIAFVAALENGWRAYIDPSADPEATVVAPWSRHHPYNQEAMHPPQATDPVMLIHQPDRLEQPEREKFTPVASQPPIVQPMSEIPAQAAPAMPPPARPYSPEEQPQASHPASSPPSQSSVRISTLYAAAPAQTNYPTAPAPSIQQQPQSVPSNSAQPVWQAPGQPPMTAPGYAPNNISNAPQPPFPPNQWGPAPRPPYAPQPQGAPPRAPYAASSGPRISRRMILIGGAAAVAAVGAIAASVLLSKGPQPQNSGETNPTSQATSVSPGPQKLIAGVPLLVFTAHTDKVWSAAWDPTSRYLASAGGDSRVMLWDTSSARQKNAGPPQAINNPLNKWQFTHNFLNNSLCWSPDGSELIAIPSTDDAIYLIDPLQKNASWQEYRDTQKSRDALPPSYENGAWAPQGKTFASTIDFQNDLLLWQKGKMNGPIGTFHYDPPAQATAGFSALAWSMDGAYIAGLTSVATVVVWDAASQQKIQELVLPERANQSASALRNALQWSPIDAHKLLVSTADIATVWDAPNNKQLASLGTDDSEALTPPDPNPSGWQPHTNGLCWSPNGRYVAGSYGRSNKIYLWDLQDSAPVRTSEDGTRLQTMMFGTQDGHNNTIIDIAWSPDGRYLATTSFDKTVIVWKVDAA